MRHVNDDAHQLLEAFAREKLVDSGWTVLPEITYHSLFGEESETSWALRKATGNLAQRIRSLPDILAINPSKKLFGIDCKTNESTTYRSASFEALPVLSAIANGDDIAYIYHDCIDKSIGYRAVMIDRSLTPKAIYLTGNDKEIDRKIIDLSIDVWPQIAINNRNPIGGSADSFLVFSESTVRSWAKPSALLKEQA